MWFYSEASIRGVTWAIPANSNSGFAGDSRLRDDAYGVTIREELERETSRTLTLGTVYKTLGRLEGKGLLETRVGPPTRERGGRRKKLYT